MTAPAHIPAPRGACPTLDDPMEVADGLLARFRPCEGLTPDQIAALGAAAGAHGNGLIEITARGNVQVRGLSRESATPFREALEAAGIVAQPGVAIEISPIAGLDPMEQADPRSLASALRAVCDAALARGKLSAKLSIVIVSGGQILLDGLKADIRLVARQDDWVIEIGGETLGALDETAISAAVAVVLERLQSVGPRARATDLPVSEIAAQIAGLSPLDHTGLRPSDYRIGPLSLSGNEPGLRIGLPFGQVKARQWADLARTMAAHGVAEARPAPDRTLALLGFASSALPSLSPALAGIGYWTRPDARGTMLPICSGAERGPDGIIQAAELAQAFFAADPDLVDGSFHLHVSTCVKGCPHAGRPGIVLGGSTLHLYRSSDEKPFASLDPGAIETGIGFLAGRIRDARRPGETTLEIFGRLGQA